jgi:hypothetical protein
MFCSSFCILCAIVNLITTYSVVALNDSVIFH